MVYSNEKMSLKNKWQFNIKMKRTRNIYALKVNYQKFSNGVVHFSIKKINGVTFWNASLYTIMGK